MPLPNFTRLETCFGAPALFFSCIVQNRQLQQSVALFPEPRAAYKALLDLGSGSSGRLENYQL